MVKKKRFENKEPDARNVFWGFILKYPYVIYAILIFTVYSQVFNHDFIEFDDHKIIVENKDKIGNLSNIGQIFTHDVYFTNEQNYRPILTLSFMLDYQIGGTNAFIYKLNNLILHIIFCSILFHFLIKMNFSREFAFIGGLLYAVHPVFVNPVVWIAARNDLLVAIFSVLAFMMIKDYFDKGGAKYLVMHALTAFLAFLSKETGVIIPLIAGIYILLVKRESLGSKKLWISISLWAMLFIIYYLLRSNALTASVIESGTMLENFLKNIRFVPELLSKFLLPYKMHVLSVFDTMLLISGLIFIGALSAGIILKKTKRTPVILFGGLWFFIFILPSTLITINTYDYIESRAYLPMLGILLILGEIIPHKIYNIRKMPVAAGVVIISTVYGALSFYQTQFYQDPFVFWEKNVKDNPRAAFRQKLGQIYIKHDMLDKAEKEFRMVASYIGDKFFDPWADLGFVYFQRKNYKQAAEFYERAVEIDSSAEVRQNLFNTYLLGGEFEKAVDLGGRMIKNDTLKTTGNYTSMLKLHMNLRQWDEAERYAQKLLKEGENLNEVSNLYVTRATETYKNGNIDMAIKLANEALRLDNKNPGAYANLGTFYINSGNRDKAEQFWLRGLKHNPDHQKLNESMYKLYFIKNNYEKALEYAHKYISTGGKVPEQQLSFLKKQVN
ncbi:MAG: tetratricopeptide repeat protein [Candidatus Kapaibacterium sp.]